MQVDAYLPRPGDGGADRRRLHALLVGVDCYPGPEVAGCPVYPPLFGAVHDCERMEGWVRRVAEERSGISPPLGPGEVVSLTASIGEGVEPAESVEERPEYGNILSAFFRIDAAAEAGDEVVLFYAGHGGRVPTAVPAVKGTEGLDTCLVPWDVGRPGARYVRDVELAYWVERWARRRVFTWLVIDCGGRGEALPRSRAAPGVTGRGIPALDLTPRPPSSLAPPSRLGRAWRARQLRRGYVLLEACRSEGVAREAPMGEDLRPSGVLTHCLLAELRRDQGEVLTYRALHARLSRRVHRHFPLQSPRISGEVDRTARRPAPSPASPPGPSRSPPPRIRLAVRASEPAGGDSRSWERSPWAAEAMTLEWARSALRYYRGEGGCAAFELDSRRSAEVSFVVGVNRAGGYEIAGADGLPLPNLPEPLPASGPDSARLLAARLLHLVRFRSVLDLGAGEGEGAAGLRLDLRPVPAAVGGRVRQDEYGGGEIRIAPGGSLVLELLNLAPRPLHVAVLCLLPDWSVERLFPPPGEGLCRLLEVGERVEMRAVAPLLPRGGSGRAVWKALGATAPLSVDDCCLPALWTTSTGDGKEENAEKYEPKSEKSSLFVSEAALGALIMTELEAVLETEL